MLSGDAEAFRDLVEREANAIIGVCRRILGDATEAEDAAQDAFLLAYRKIGSYRGDGPLGGWLMRIAVREAQHRAKHRRAVVSLDGDHADAFEPAAAVTDGGLDPVAIAEGHEETVRVRTAVDGLPERYRTAVRLRFLEDRSFEEIAATTGRPPATVRTHLHRGLLRLRERLGTENRS